MAYTILFSGSWADVACDTDAELTAALALPGSWSEGPSVPHRCLVRNDQVVHLSAAATT
jgi:hypothetical protein